MIESKHDELKLRDEWLAEAREMTAKKLPEFVKKLSEFDHDYGTICRAIAAAGIAAAWAVERSPKGDITMSQASCIMWDLITGWMDIYEGKPLKLVDYSEMLYPQYAEKFQKVISQDTWEYLQSQARESLTKNEKAIDRIRDHWKAIADGIVPFGYRVETK